jgi:hypothetical protein
MPLGPGPFHDVSASLLPAAVNLVDFDNLHFLPYNPVEVGLGLVHRGEEDADGQSKQKAIFEAFMPNTHARETPTREQTVKPVTIHDWLYIAVKRPAPCHHPRLR